MNIASVLPSLKPKVDNSDTLGTLYALFEQREALRATLIGRIHKKELDKFIDQNSRTHETLLGRMQDLSRQFFAFGEDGKMVMAVKQQPHAMKGFRMQKKNSHVPDLHPRPVLLTGKTMEEYNKVFSELMAEPCQIN